MPRFRALVLVGLFLVHQAAGHSLAAQAAPATGIAPGARVRVRFDCTTRGTHESCHTATGTVTNLAPERLTFTTGSVEQSVTPATLNEISVYGGTGHRTVRGLLIGLGAGAVAGYVTISITNGGCIDQSSSEMDNFCLYGTAVGSVTGALLGAGIGSLIRYDRWRPAPSPWSAARTDRPTLRLLLTPPLRSRPGMLGVAIGF